MDERELPGGRFSRFARLAATGLRTGIGMVTDPEGAATALAAARALGTLRGLAAKVGQMASYVDGVIPEGQREVWEGAMKGLRAAAPSSSPDEVRGVITRELGGAPEELFAEWDPRPFASASIGQVHRARLHDGRAVAVKVQHPGVAEAVESDLANAGMMESVLAPMGLGRHDSKGILEVIRARFREELDYRHEAENYRHFAGLFEGDGKVRVPAVIDDRSAAMVLTTEFVEGRGFDEAIAATEAERVAWAETLWRFVFRGNMSGGRFNADPHPGNYVFHPGGAVSFLDFGCVQRIEHARRVRAANVHRAAMAGDEARFAKDVLVLVEGRPGRMGRMSVDFTRHCFEPLFESPYKITRPYVAGLLEEMKTLAKATRQVPDEEFFKLPADMAFMNRLQFGFYSVLARLDVTVDYRAAEARFIDEAPRE